MRTVPANPLIDPTITPLIGDLCILLRAIATSSTLGCRLEGIGVFAILKGTRQHSRSSKVAQESVMAVDSHKVQKPLKKMGKLIKKISGSPSIEEVHSLRTHPRQIEAAFAALEVDSM